MTVSLESAIVRLHSTKGAVVGVGFMVAERRILTCAYVVASALCLRPEPSDLPHDDLYLDFPLLAPGRMATARVIQWRPDAIVAGLDLTSAPPPGAAPIRLLTADDLGGHSFRAFGFPAGRERGVWASGVLRSRQANGWVLVEDVKQTGYLSAPGFSGGPIWDDVLEGAVGMIVAADVRERVKAPFLIPADVVAAAWPDIVCTYVEPAVRSRGTPARQPGGVTIGNVTGGIHDSIVAGGDVRADVGSGVQTAAVGTGPPLGRTQQIKLRQILTERFDEGELRTLCFDLGVDYDGLPGRGKAEKARDIVAYLERREQLQELVEVGRQHRSDISWNGVLGSD